MLFKFFTVGALLYILYRISMPNPLNKGQIDRKSKKKQSIEDRDDYIDYEEID